MTNNRQSYARRAAYIAREWFHTYIWKFRKESLTPLGFRMVSGSYAANREMLTGQFEQEEVAVIESMLQSVPVFVDVGANIGFYTCLALKMGKRVIAVEPKRSNLDLLYRNMTINQWENVEVYPVGLTDRPGLRRIYGATGTAASLLKGWAGHSEKICEVIPTTTLDVILQGSALDNEAIFVKIDVEGFEYFVLKGALKTLSRVRQTSWLVEICLNEYHPDELNSHYLETFVLMWDHGYEAFTANAERRPIKKSDVETWVKNKACDSGVINYLFVKPSHSV